MTGPTAFPLLSAALDDHATTFFFRDDDAGWADDRLLALVEVFAGRAPLDLAVIPAATTRPLAERLLAHPGALGFHQHGWAHVDHQVQGRKCEFGPDRTPDQQGADVRRGRARLADLFGARLDDVFTPPWNRCSPDLVPALLDAGVKVLSRDRGARRLDVGSLLELPVDVDWVRARADLDARLADAVTTSSDATVGVMLHHAEHDRADRRAISALLTVLDDHPRAAMRAMADVAATRGVGS